MKKRNRINEHKILIEDVTGKPFEKAQEIAKSNGYTVRVIRRDDENFMVTFDLNFLRINFEVDNDIITRASIG